MQDNLSFQHFRLLCLHDELLFEAKTDKQYTMHPGEEYIHLAHQQRTIKRQTVYAIVMRAVNKDGVATLQQRTRIDENMKMDSRNNVQYSLQIK